MTSKDRVVRNRTVSFFASLSAVVVALSSPAPAQDVGVKAESPADNLPPYITRLTHFGQRADWSHDGTRILFIEKTFGDVYEVDVDTKIIRPITHHYYHEGYTRALYLSNGDILLSGSRVFDARKPMLSRHGTAELWVLDKSLTKKPEPLGEFCYEGPAVSRTRMKIAWTVHHGNYPERVPRGVSQIWLGEITHDGGAPQLVSKRKVLDSRDLPFKCTLETQNFRPPDERELIFTTYDYQGGEVFGLDIETGKVRNYSNAPDSSEEPEGIFPDGQYTCVERVADLPYAFGKSQPRMDVWKLKLDGSGQFERLTHFSDYPEYRATNPVVSDDGRFMAFQMAKATESAGVGHGIFIYDLERAAKPLEESREPGGSVTGKLNKWCRVSVTFDGPETSEAVELNPFRNYRLLVTFTHEKTSYTVPGFYAADGNAADTGAAAGNKWRVYFTPDEEGVWTYRASFRTGTDIAISTDPDAGTATSFDGATGTFRVLPPDTNDRDARRKGRLQYIGQHYLRFAETGQYFLKGGADSPENFLAYYEFDQTLNAKHRYEPHRGDFRSGDPTWRDGNGKNIIGALNYLASKGMNSVYFLTMNVKGDGNDVWPWTAAGERLRFDCSKLDQWEIVFSHMDKLGLMLHVITQETENDQLLDEGDLGIERKLYYRELVARFAHHNALVWNLGEENTNTDAQRKAFAHWFRALDPYDHPLVVHTFPKAYDRVYEPLLGFPCFEGPSLQTNDTHAQTIKWIDRSVWAGRKWFVCLDEIGPAHTGVKPDADDYWHDEVRKKHLWGNLMAGGAGVEWYFGYHYPHSDLDCEDWRSRDHLWDLTGYALEFFRNHLPFHEMTHHDALTSSPDDYCFAKPGGIYAIYLPNGGTTTLDLGESTDTFAIKWYNPREGGPLADGSVTSVKGPGNVSIGSPPTDTNKDWAVLVKCHEGRPVLQ